MSDADKKRKAEILANAERVHAIAQKVLDLVVKETADITDGGSRWLIMSRVFSTLFQRHFHVSVAPTERTIAKVLSNSDTVENRETATLPAPPPEGCPL